jgi:hypothetical protein
MAQASSIPLSDLENLKLSTERNLFKVLNLLNSTETF